MAMAGLKTEQNKTNKQKKKKKKKKNVFGRFKLKI